MRQRVIGAEHPHTLLTRSAIARAQLDQGKASDAEASWQDVLPLCERAFGLEHPEPLVVRYRLAQAVLAQGRTIEAREAVLELRPIARGVMVETDPRLGYIAFLCAQCADELGDPSAADTFIAEAQANWGDRLTAEHPFRRELSAYLADRNKPSDS